MVSPVENRSLLTARVLGRSAHPTVGRWDVLRVRVEDIAEVEGMPNLLAETAGTEIDLNVDRDQLPDGPLDGRTLRAPVRLAGPETVVALPAGAAAGALEVEGPAQDEEPPAPR